MIRIDVVRDDGDITRLNGESGIAVCAPEMDELTHRSDPAIVSMRCSTAAQLAWNLATVLASVRAVSPEAYDYAHELMRFIDARHPQLHRRLP